MRCLVVFALVALVVAEPPATKDSSVSETKDKRGAVTYGTTGDYSTVSSAAAGIPHSAAIGYSGIGHASPYLLSGAGLGYGGYGLSGLSGLAGLQAPISVAGLGHGLGYGAQPLVLPANLGYGAVGVPSYAGLGGISGIHGYSAGLPVPAIGGLGISGLSLASPSLKLSQSESYSQPDISLTPPSKTYGVPSQSSYSSSFQPITSSYSSPSTSYGVPSSSYSAPSSSYSVPSSSYSAPSSSYGVPSNSYSVPSSSYSSPSSSYGVPASDSYNTVSYSGSRDYRSNH